MKPCARSPSEPRAHASALTACIVLLLLAPAARPAGEATDTAEDSALHGDIEVAVSLDANEQSGQARATVKIHATRAVIWPLITRCVDVLTLIPGLVGCSVLETAPDGSSQLIRQVMNYSWYIPTLTYEIRAVYHPPARVSIERVAGDIRSLSGSWDLEDDGEYTLAHYGVALAPGFWVPRWMVRTALRRDLPKMLRALRARAEYLQQRSP